MDPSRGQFSTNKYVLRIKSRPMEDTIPESDEDKSALTKNTKASDSSSSTSTSKSKSLKKLKEKSKPNTGVVHRNDGSTDSTDMSVTSSSSQTTTSRMENGAKIPRLAIGPYFTRPAPPPPGSASDDVLSGNPIEGIQGPTTSLASPAEMRQPPPTWQPPCPPDGDPDYENNYEDPEELQQRFKAGDGSRDFLLASAPPAYNSYEMSLSQQRRSNMTASGNSGEDWSDDQHRVLHKSAEGTYYIPAGTSGSMRTTTSTLSPSSQGRYQDQCAGMSSSLLTRSRPSDPATATLLKYPTTASISGTHINKKRPPKIDTTILEKEDMKHRKLPWCTLLLAACLFFALVLVAILLLRPPSYVYIERTPTSSAEMQATVDSSLRPLPTVIYLGQRAEAELVPKQMALTELVISRPTRVRFNLTQGAGAQIVLLGRHSVPPSLYIHDFFRPLRAHQPSPPKPSHVVENRRLRRHAYEIIEPRSAVAEEFLLEGTWYIMLINERNRVEPITLTTSAVGAPVENPLQVLAKCDLDCSGHGECVAGKCRCSAGYAGDSCEDPVCPVVCSGNGVFSGGSCICKTGYKGKECDVRSHWCEVPDCSGRGRCSPEGICVCEKGWTGDACEKRDCPHSRCNDHGVCVNGTCYCEDGFRGDDCSSRVAPPRQVESEDEMPTKGVSLALGHQPVVVVPTPYEERPKLGGPTALVTRCLHGRAAPGGICECDYGWNGGDCSVYTCPMCRNGQCSNSACICYSGWQGTNCDQLSCAIGCQEHGKCSRNGTCACEKGWNGENCQIEGCPSSCSGNGDCLRSTTGWYCSCQPGRTGKDCGIPVEVDCRDGLDNDNDDLIDCDDPECCSSSYCAERGSCVYSASPAEALLRMPTLKNAEFAQRVAFLYQNDLQKYADPTQFNDSLVSIVRGRVSWDGGANSVETAPLVGVRVSDGQKPLWGFTLSRLDGEFDLVVNGGQTVQLRFQRNPFMKTVRNIFVPPNEIVYIGDVQLFQEKRPDTMKLPARGQCQLSARSLPNPSIRSSWQLGSESSGLEGLMVDTRSAVLRIPLPGTSMDLVYDSARVPGSQSWLVMGLLDEDPDESLRTVFVEIDVAGRRFDFSLAPRPNLTYVWAWDKQNIYRQSEHGLVNVYVRIGYEYRGCDRPSEIAWTWQNLKLEAAGSRILEGGAWSLSIHHHLDVINNVLELGTGGRRFLSQQSPRLETIVGGKEKRDLECYEKCNRNSYTAPLLRPTALAFAPDGSLYIGDNELIRRVGVDGKIKTVLKLTTADTSHSYHLAVSPVDGNLYISMSLRKHILKLISLEPIDPANNHEIVAGDGTTCTSHASLCGDGGPAEQAQLIMPKGIDFDADGNLYVVDGRRLRIIDRSGTVKSIGNYANDRPPKCQLDSVAVDDLQLEWPTSVAVHRATGLIYVLDSNVIYEVDQIARTVKVVLGSLPQCPDSDSTPLRSAKDIAVGVDGLLYVVESDGKQINQIRRYDYTTRSLSIFAGQNSLCSCDMPSCICDDFGETMTARDAQFNSPSAITVAPNGDVFVADTANAKVKKLSKQLANYNSLARTWTVVDEEKNELYAFNRHGLHIWTQSLNSGKVMYNFTYNVDTSLGKLSQIHGAGDLLFRIIRANETHTAMEAPNGQRSHLYMSAYDGNVDRIQPAGKELIKLHYGSGSLLESVSQSGKAIVFGYDDKGRAQRLRRDSEEYTLQEHVLLNGRYSTAVLRNGRPYAVYTNRQNEVTLEKDGDESTRLLILDSGYLLHHDGITTLFDKQTHPNHLKQSVLHVKSTVPGIKSPPRRELTSRFDWRPFIKRAGAERRVAEVGNRPMINGINTYSTSFERDENKDVIRARNNDEELISLQYSDSGELEHVRQPGDVDGESYGVANLSITFDALGRRNIIHWGNFSLEASYDRQNRVVERQSSIKMLMNYTKDFRLPSNVVIGDSLKYQIKHDFRGRLREVTSPIGEVHSFSRIPAGSESVIVRKYPHTKKPFRTTVDSQKAIVEWTTPDDLHQLIVSRDDYGRRLEEMCDGSSTFFKYADGRILSVYGSNLTSSFVYQGPLLVELRQSMKKLGEKWIESSFAMEYDDALRVTSVQAAVEGTAVEPIQITHDERSGMMNGISGYQILKESTVVRIQGYKMLHETTLNEYRIPSSMKVAFGDIRVSLNIQRDQWNRMTAREWKIGSSIFKEIRKHDAFGRIVVVDGKEGRRLITYNNDGRPNLVNDESWEWHHGGVPKRVGRVDYGVDANGWTIRRGNVAFELDCVGRLIGAKDANQQYKIVYDEQNRVVWIQRGQIEHSLFYALTEQPTVVSHFTTTGMGPATIFWGNSAQPFAMTRDGYRYALLADDEGSLRAAISESGVVKEKHYDFQGMILQDSDPALWIPIGFLGGIDIPEISITIINGRPLDLISGRYLSFGPEQASQLTFDHLPSSLDFFARKTEEFRAPQDFATLFGLIGLSPKLLPPISLPLTQPVSPSVASRVISSFPSKTKLFTNPLSVQPSALLEQRSPLLLPTDEVEFVPEDVGFADLFVLIPLKNTTIVDPLPALSADDRNLLSTIFKEATEIAFHHWATGIERHFVRPGVPSSVASESRSHFTIVVSKERIELRSGKNKIVIHFGDESSILQSLVSDLRRREGPAVWRAEKRRLERGEAPRYSWTPQQAKELLSKSVVSGFTLRFENQLNSRFPTVHQWKFIRS